MSEQNFDIVLEELNKDVLNPELIQDNKLHFRCQDKIYRVRMPNQKEVSEANSVRNKKFISLLQEDGTITEKQLRKVLKEKQDIDIEKMEIEADKLAEQLTQCYISLAKCKDSEKKKIDKKQKEIYQVRQKRLSIVLEKAQYLSPAIENQAQDEYYRFLTSLCTEVYDEKKEKWNKVWKNFKQYEKDNSNIAYVALGRLTELTLNV